MFANFDFNVIARSWVYVIRDGLSFTLLLTALASAGGMVLGTALALLRLARVPLVPQLAAGYVNLMRALPLVLVIFWFYFLVPYLGQWLIGAERPIQVGGFASALITFTLFEAAYYAEIVRAGIRAVPRGQLAAAQALGLRNGAVMRYVVLPQAMRHMLPIILTQTIVLFQDTSLVYVLSLTDLFGAASKVAHRDGRLVEMYLFAALVYFALSLAASRGVRMLQVRTAIAR
jgi:glutamate/aspartate transport system permease protein